VFVVITQVRKILFVELLGGIGDVLIRCLLFQALRVAAMLNSRFLPATWW